MGETVKINRLSDNTIKFTIKTINGDLVNPNAIWIKVYLKSGGKVFKAINDPIGDETSNSHIVDNYLYIDIPGKKLNPGILEYMIETREYDENFDDNYKNTLSLNYKQTNIEVI